MASALYTRDILRLATSIPHLGRLDPVDGSAEVRSPVCGSRVAVDVRLDGQGRVTALGIDPNACALGQAACALMGQHALGQSFADLDAARLALTDWLSGARADPGDWPGLDVFQPALTHHARHAAIRLAFEAVTQAMENAGRG